MTREISDERPLTFQLDQDHLFKYCDAHGIDILQHLRLKITPPNEFNDPFEFLPKVDFCMDENDLKGWLTDSKQIRTLWEQGGRGISFEDFFNVCKGMFDNLAPAQLERLRKSLQELSVNDRENVVDFISETRGLSCFSEIADNLLMWSHYTKGHRGIVVEFNLKSDFMSATSN